MLTEIGSAESAPKVAAGPVLRDFLQTAAGCLGDYLGLGGFSCFENAPLPSDWVDAVDRAGVRGRGGGGFPAAVKWRQVARKDSPHKFLVCNLNSGQPGGFKERWLLKSNPFRILEAVAVAAYAVGARTAIIYLGRSLKQEARSLSECIDSARSRGILGTNGVARVDVQVFRSPGGYVSGEETALLELLEGRPGQPRRKPPMPTSAGLFGHPTVVQNVDTLLQALYVLNHGVENYQRLGLASSPGTLILCLGGALKEPGIYEVEAGTLLRHLLLEAGGGQGGFVLQAAIVGGTSGGVVPERDFDLSLDYDSISSAGLDLGSGVILGLTERHSIYEAALEVARFFQRNSCGKCQPCWDGNERIVRMLEQIGSLDEKGIDVRNREVLPSLRTPEGGLRIINESVPLGPLPSYTDTVKGLYKIHHLAEWYKYRGDCHFSAESAFSIQRMLTAYEGEFQSLMISEPGERKD